MELNKYSKAVTQDPTQPAAQAMLHAIGLTDEDFKKPLIGIASLAVIGTMSSGAMAAEKSQIAA